MCAQISPFQHLVFAGETFFRSKCGLIFTYKLFVELKSFDLKCGRDSWTKLSLGFSGLCYWGLAVGGGSVFGSNHKNILTSSEIPTRHTVTHDSFREIARPSRKCDIDSSRNFDRKVGCKSLTLKRFTKKTAKFWNVEIVKGRQLDGEDFFIFSVGMECFLLVIQVNLNGSFRPA